MLEAANRLEARRSPFKAKANMRFKIFVEKIEIKKKT